MSLCSMLVQKMKSADAQMKTEQQIAELMQAQQVESESEREEFDAPATPLPVPAPAPAVPTFGVFSVALEPAHLFIDGVRGEKALRRMGLLACEYVPMNRVSAFLHNDCPFLGMFYSVKTGTDTYTDEYKAITQRQLETYVQHLTVRNKNRHILTTQYKRTPYRIKGSTRQYVFGRAFNEKWLGLTALPKKVRNALIKDHYYDFDLENAHPAICIALAKGLNIDTPCLQHYISHREDCLNTVMSHYGVNRVLAKKLFLRLCFSGTVVGWKKEFDIKTETDVQFPIDFSRELETIAKALVPHNTLLYQIAHENKEDKRTEQEKAMNINQNYRGSFFGLFMQEIETRIVSAVMEYLVKHTRLCRVDGFGDLTFLIYEYDGIKLLKRLVDDYEGISKAGKEGVLELLRVKTKELTGIELNWTEKEIDTFHDLTPFLVPDPSVTVLPTVSENPNRPQAGIQYRIAETDEEAAGFIYEELKDRLKCYDGRLFFKTSNVWVEEMDTLTAYLMNHIMNSNIYGAITKDDKLIPFAQNRTKAKHIYETVIDKVKMNPDSELYNKFHRTTEGRLCFKDGVLDFATKQFYEWENLPFEIYTTTCVPRPFKDAFANPDEELQATIRNKIMEPMFGEKTDLALRFFARAMAGKKEDKNWASMYGNRDCGKGVMTQLFNTAFGNQYVQAFTTNNILCTRKTMGENAGKDPKALYWVLEYEFARLALGNETPDPEKMPDLVVNAPLMKQLISGGDVFEARRNYDKRNKRVELDFSLIIFGNHPLRIETVDVLEHLLEFKSAIQFKSPEEIADEKRALRAELGWETENITQEERAKIELQVEIATSHLREGNPLIKDEVKKVEYGNALVHLLLKSYTNEKVCVIPERDLQEVSDCSIRSVLLKHYEISRNPGDMVLMSEFKETMHGYNVKKVVVELEAMGCKKMKCKSGEFRDKLVIQGLKAL